MIDDSKAHCEYLRRQSKEIFEKVRPTWYEAGRWAAPHRSKALVGRDDGDRANQHIVDGTHLLSLRSFVAGFLEGNTSASRPWFRAGHPDPEVNRNPANRLFFQNLTTRTLNQFSVSNFYHAAGQYYYDYGVFNTGAHYIDELENPKRVFFHTLDPGTYFVINNSLGEAVVLVREYTLTVKALVDKYGKKVNGKWDWSMFSSTVKRYYEEGNYTKKIDLCHIVKENCKYDPMQPAVMNNRRWVSKEYELGTVGGQYYQEAEQFMGPALNGKDDNKFLRQSYSQRKPFIVGASNRSRNFEYGEQGPTTDSLGLIKSLNKKAIGKDIALEKMLSPATQGPASLKKSYITNAANAYIPLDPQAMKDGGLRAVNQINPAIATLNADVSDMRQAVEKFYYADFLMFLSRNPKTRTATETNAVVAEQQLIIGPNLQSLNWTYNIPVVEWMMGWVLDNDAFLGEVPEDLQGEPIRTEFISVFAQSQKAADLPSVERYIAMLTSVGQLNPTIWDKANLDELCNLYENRLFLPVGINRTDEETDEIRAQRAQAQAKQAQMEQLVQASSAAKNVGIQAQQPE